MGFDLLLPNGSLVDVPVDAMLQLRLKYFDSEFYRTHIHCGEYPDLLNLSYYELITHFLHRGKIEGRSYNRYINSYIDGHFYKLKYPKLNLKSAADAVVHWNYFGVYQLKIPNSVTDEILNSEIHLFQMGKVGSKSIESALMTSGCKGIIPHLHFASDLFQIYPDCFYSYPEVVAMSSNPIKFIAGVREPISRVYSGIIESIVDPKSSLTFEIINEKIHSKKAFEEFIFNQSTLVLDWFEHNFFSDIDVYSHPFDKKLGFGCCEGDRNTLFVYRLDKLSTLWNELSNFTGYQLNPTVANVIEDKSYELVSLYKKMMGFCLSKPLLDRVYNSGYCQHFFSENEIFEFKRMYSRL